MFPQLFGIKGIRILKRFRSEPFNSKYWPLKYLAEEKSNFRITTFTEHPLGNKYFVKEWQRDCQIFYYPQIHF